MKKRLPLYFLYITSLLVLFSCSPKTKNNTEKKITLFFVNDQHARLDNFAKIKYIIDKEKEKQSVVVACSGDIFSGSPVVDNYKDNQGYPMIDVMNRVGFDVSVLGNHEFDYGEETLKDRMDQSNFKWVCANVDMLETNVPQPNEYYTVVKDGLKITFLGLVETNGKDNGTIPSTHPWKVQNFAFQRPEAIVNKYKNVKKSEGSDLFIALTHLGHSSNKGLGDVQLAEQYPYFDLIVGGHSHQEINTVENGVPIFQSGSYLKKLGKIEISVKNKAITNIKYTLINLDEITEYDQNLKDVIDGYNNLPDLKEVVGESLIYHEEYKVGCFYADALKSAMNVDVSFQNSGGVRSSLDKGDITKKEIYTIEPFNNGTVKYDMSVQQVKDFLIGSKSGFYYSGIIIEQVGGEVEIKSTAGNLISNSTMLSVGLNDYIPAVHDRYFPKENKIQDLSAAESIMYYLQNTNSEVNYTSCANYFKYTI
jgi:2',3'-cyclic-nucleotide 2'-phosphodiesterase (5'-nucleotidase family)